jgi:hypothetical protein
MQGFLAACCHLMKVSEREQAQQFMVVVKVWSLQCFSLAE